MVKCFQMLFIILIFNTRAQSQCETKAFVAPTVCLACAEDINRIFQSDIINKNLPVGSQSVLIIRESNEEENVALEKTVLQNLKNRIRSYAFFPTSFLDRIITLAESNPDIKMKLLYQLSLDSNGQSRTENSRSKPQYKIEKEAQHKLWGFHLTHNKQAFVMINEYQNVWNADYILIHELFHLLDSVSQTYIEEHEQNWHLLDELALEYRAFLAEAYYRMEMVQTTQFKVDCMAQDDFRDRFISAGYRDVVHERLLNYVLDLFYPIHFNNETAVDMTETFEIISKFFIDFFSKFEHQSVNKPYTAAQALEYGFLPTEDIKRKNERIRRQLVREARARGSSDIIDYFVRSKIVAPITSGSLRIDRKFNVKPSNITESSLFRTTRGGP